MTGRTNAGGGVQLPALTNPAAAGNIQSGYQAINGEGEVVTGTAVTSSPAQIDFINTTQSTVSIYYGGVNSDGKINYWNVEAASAGERRTLNSFVGAIIAVSSNDSNNISSTGSNIRPIAGSGKYVIVHILADAWLQIA